MRDKNLNPSLFRKELETAVLKLVSKKSDDLRSDVIAISNFQHEGSRKVFPLKDLKFKDFVRLSIFSWYTDKIVGVMLRMELEERLKFFSTQDRVILECLLSSKANMINFLEATTLWHTRDFFGNILSKNNNLDKFFRKRHYEKWLIKKPQRKRGYDDHGSRVEDYKKLPKYDWSLTELQNKIEEERIRYRDTVAFLQGFLGG